MMLMSKHANLMYECITYYIYAYHDFGRSLDVLRTLFTLARTGTDAGSEAMHTRMYDLFRWRTYRKTLPEFLEHLASDNGADIHKYNTLYTHRLNRHVLTPTSYREYKMKQ